MAPQARPGLSVPPVHPEPKVPTATKDRPALKDPLALLVPKDKGETPARRATLGPRDPKAKEGVTDPPGPWAHRNDF